MQSSPYKLDQLVNRLLEKTQKNDLKWESTTEMGRFHTRLGDFLVQISSGQTYTLGSTKPSVSFIVKKLDGRTIENVTTGQQNALTFSGGQHLLPSTEAKLQNLYSILNDSNRDIDELIGLLS